MGRAPCCEKVGLKKGRWTAEEDEILTKYIQANGEGSWRSLPKNAGLLRCGKSCRLRWINYLRADLKRGNISAEEESIIIKLHASYGNRWSLIASHMRGRTDNEIKNYWNSHLSRKIYSFRSTSNNNKENPTVPIIMDIPPKRRGGRTSRWAMKKNKSYAPKKVHNQSQRVTHHNTEKVPLPPTTPALESENLTMVMDFMALEPDTEDKVEREEKEEEEEEEEELGGGDGSSSKCSSQQKENEGTTVLNHEQCEVKEDATRINDVLCLEGEEKREEILGPNKENINGGGQLSFNDFMDTCFVEEASGVLSLTFGEEREINYELVGNEEEAGKNTCTTNKMVRVTGEDILESSVNQSSNGESGELCSCSSMASGLDELEWDWESVIQLNGNDVSESSLEQKENPLSWLWEDDDWKKDGKELGDIDPELDVMVAWFLS